MGDENNLSFLLSVNLLFARILLMDKWGVGCQLTLHIICTNSQKFNIRFNMSGKARDVIPSAHTYINCACTHTAGYKYYILLIKFYPF